jgi:3-hydroxyisobutyrate dehydrogenase-like beta-hydroxyacid dehydrogenase
MQQVKLGFLGFGEVAYHLARGLERNGLSGIVAYSRSGAQASSNDPVSRRAAEAGVQLVATPRELCERTDMIIAVTPGRAALEALSALLPHLRPDHLYVDASTAAVDTMKKAEALLEGKSHFVDAAIMDAVPLGGVATPVVASGPHGLRFQELLAPYGMNIEVVSDKAGAASAMKLIRSVSMKGLAAVLIESLEAAQRHGILDAVFRSIATSMDERPFAHTIKRYVCGTAIHAERRVHEMSEALELLEALGSSSRMTRATRAKLLDVADLGLREHFGGREPDTVHPVIEATVAASS